METSFDTRNKLGGQGLYSIYGYSSIKTSGSQSSEASEILDWIHLIESKPAVLSFVQALEILISPPENFAALKKRPCRVRVVEIEAVYGASPAWKVIVFQMLSENVDMPIYTYEDTNGRVPSSLKDVLQQVFLESCQQHA